MDVLPYAFGFGPFVFVMFVAIWTVEAKLSFSPTLLDVVYCAIVFKLLFLPFTFFFLICRLSFAYCFVIVFAFINFLLLFVSENHSGPSACALYSLTDRSVSHEVMCFSSSA